MTDLRHRKVHKSILIVMKYRLIYLKFVNSFKRVYIVLSQKNTEYFAIVFQDSNSNIYL